MMAEIGIKKFAGVCRFDRTETDIKKQWEKKDLGTDNIKMVL
jgi:hypothetical protein